MDVLNPPAAHGSSPGTGKFLFKTVLCVAYSAVCAAVETIQPSGVPDVTQGAIIAAIVLVPLLVCAPFYAMWWRRADEFQKSIDTRARAAAGIGGVTYLVLLKLMSYFVPVAIHIPSLAVIGMVLVYWVGRSHGLNVRALKA